MPEQTPSDVHVNKPIGEEEKSAAGIDPEQLAAGVDEEMDEHDIDEATATKLATDHLRKDPDYYRGALESKAAPMSPEYLSAFHESARKVLQGWHYDQIHAMALPKAGGFSGRRKPEHSELERALLGKLSGELVRDMSDEALLKAWQEIERWHKLATRKRLDTGDYEKAAECIADELERRGSATMDPEGHLARAIISKTAAASNVLAVYRQPDGTRTEVIAKAWREKQIIWYAIAVPFELDAYDHRITREEVEDACHRYTPGPRLICMEHGEKAGLNFAGRWPAYLTGKAVCVESGLTLQETTAVFGQRLERALPEGTWYGAIFYPDGALWRLLRDTPHGISWRGWAQKTPRQLDNPSPALLGQ